MAERARRKICVITGSRAEYGNLYWLMKEIEADPDLALQLVVTGAHLSPQFGDTWKVIEEDGFSIDERVDIGVGDDTPVGIARSMGLTVSGMGEAFNKLNPDIIVVLGDRYEFLATACAAVIARIPIAHIAGGEVTEGALDDPMRHAITKLASLHFVAAEPYANRVIQLGEMPERVFTVGAPGLDSVDKISLLDQAGMEKALDLPSGSDFLLVTYHPATLGDDDPGLEAQEMLAALDRFPDHRVVITGVNSDPGSNRIAQLLANYVADNSGRAALYPSLGQVLYLSAMKHAAVVIGNSSSGIVEAPAMNRPSVNIGDRQKGRLRAASIIDCAGKADDIADAINRALDPAFREGFLGMVTPYGAGGAAKKTTDAVKAADLSQITRTSFHDIEFNKVAS